MVWAAMPVESDAIHATSSGRSSTTVPSAPGDVITTDGGSATVSATGPLHAPHSLSAPWVRTRTETVVGDSAAVEGSW